MYSLLLMSAMAGTPDVAGFGYGTGCSGCTGVSVSYAVAYSSCGGCCGPMFPRLSQFAQGVGRFARASHRSAGCFGPTFYSSACYGSSCYGSACYGSCYGSSCLGSGCYGGGCYGSSCFGSGCYGSAPVIYGVEFTRWHILLYTILLLIVTLLPYLTGMAGFFYLGGAIILGAGFLYYAIRLMNPPDELFAYKTFNYSILYLAALFAFLLIDHYLPQARALPLPIVFEPG